jgi:hypothetical protein
MKERVDQVFMVGFDNLVEIDSHRGIQYSIPSGPRSTGMVAVTVMVSVSMTLTVLSPPHATNACLPSGETITPPGVAPTLMTCSCCREAAS